MSNKIDAYRVGLLDAVCGREPLTIVLAIAGETEWLIEYANGLIVGRLLVSGDELGPLL